MPHIKLAEDTGPRRHRLADGRVIESGAVVEVDQSVVERLGHLRWYTVVDDTTVSEASDSDASTDDDTAASDDADSQPARDSDTSDADAETDTQTVDADYETYPREQLEMMDDSSITEIAKDGDHPDVDGRSSREDIISAYSE